MSSASVQERGNQYWVEKQTHGEHVVSPAHRGAMVGIAENRDCTVKVSSETFAILCIDTCHGVTVEFNKTMVQTYVANSDRIEINCRASPSIMLNNVNDAVISWEGTPGNVIYVCNSRGISVRKKGGEMAENLPDCTSDGMVGVNKFEGWGEGWTSDIQSNADLGGVEAAPAMLTKAAR